MTKIGLTIVCSFLPILVSFGQEQQVARNHSNNVYIEFEMHSYHLTKNGRLLLDSLVASIRERAKTVRYEYDLIVEACNCWQEKESNRFIGVQRALTVIDYLSDKGVKRYHCKITDTDAVDYTSCTRGYVNIVGYINMNKKLIDEW